MNTLAQNRQPVIPHHELPHATADGREAILRRLLPVDYEYAQRAGLIDQFHYDPTTGDDGLLHTLGGETVTTPDGAVIVEGFHHEASAPYIWPEVRTAEGGGQPVTYADHAYPPTLKAKEAKAFRWYPLEPWSATVVVNGLVKYAAIRGGAGNASDEVHIKRAKSSMFPKEYDALAVMQTVRIAMESRNTANDQLMTDVHGHEVVISEGSAPLLDGITPMRVRLILDRQSGKVRTAFPLLPSNPGMLKLTQEQADAHIYGGVANYIK